MKTGVSKVYTDRPDYADFDSPAKFEAIKSIIAKRLREHPNAICSYSDGVLLVLHIPLRIRGLNHHYDLNCFIFCHVRNSLHSEIFPLAEFAVDAL